MAGYISPDRCAGMADLVTVRTPWGISVRVHKALKQRFMLACKRAHKYAPFTPKRMDSYACRAIRGSTKLSRHAVGAAWDIFITDPSTPPPGGVWEPDDTFGARFARCFTDLGFTWGSQWQRQDWPHIEWSGNYVPAVTTKERITTFKLAKQRQKKAQEKKGGKRGKGR